MAERPALETLRPEYRDAHPYLDPHLQEQRPDFFRALHRVYDTIRDDDVAYNTFLNRMLNPATTQRTLESNRITAAYYLNEAGRYVDALLDLFHRRQRVGLRPDRAIAETQDVRELLGIYFGRCQERCAFEARRKLYIAKLFFDVDHTWEVQHGDVHRAYFAELLERELFCHSVGHREVDIAFDIAADGLRIDYRVGTPLPNEEVWRFYLNELNFLQDGRPVRVQVYFYSCRSKREVLPFRYVRGQQIYQIETQEKWTELSLRRDASIVSKMLRKGISNPREISDIVGAMFIVASNFEVEVLKQALFDMVGGPMKVNHVVDTLTRPEDRRLLHDHSGAGYQVYKGDLDVLFPAARGVSPYSFIVELQIYTLETYLRTIHTRHYANHQRLKRRQFLEGLVPLLFPAQIYGAGVGAPAAYRPRPSNDSPRHAME